VVALAIGAAVVTALAANPEVKPDLAAANSEANANPASLAAAKSDRLAIRPLKPAAAPPKPAAGPVTSGPYGCQWRSPPTRKVYRSSRPG